MNSVFNLIKNFLGLVSLIISVMILLVLESKIIEKLFKFLQNNRLALVGISLISSFIIWLDSQPLPDLPATVNSNSVTVLAEDKKYSTFESDYLLQSNNQIILASNSDMESESNNYTKGIVESDIEEDTQFVLPTISGSAPETLPIGGFVNLKTYLLTVKETKSSNVQTLIEHPFEPSQPPVSPMINPDWFRSELNPQFSSFEDRKRQHQRSLSLAAERTFNNRRRQQRRPYYGVAVKNRIKFYHPYPQVRDKFHHAPIIGVPIPITWIPEWSNLCNNSNHAGRIKVFRDPKKLPNEFVEIAAIRLREHVIDPNTRIIKGTFGKRMAARRQLEMRRNKNLRPLVVKQGFLLYNSKTNLVFFYDKRNNCLVTYLIANKNQRNDINDNQNIL